MAKKLTHLNERGEARMVDIGAKPASERRAVARGLLRISKDTIGLIRDGTTPKGDVLGTARIAGVMAAKKTSELIPLAHPLPLTHVAVDLALTDDGVAIEAQAATTAQTGVEMEALTAGGLPGRTAYAMLKAGEGGAGMPGLPLGRNTGRGSGDVGP